MALPRTDHTISQKKFLSKFTIAQLEDRAVRAMLELWSKNRRERAWARTVLKRLIEASVVEYYWNHRRIGVVVFQKVAEPVIEVGGIQ